MSKVSLLSAEVSRCRAVALGGGTPEEVLGRLRRWRLGAPTRGSSVPGPRVLKWGDGLCGSIVETLGLGAPVGKLLREVHPLVRREERNWTRLQALERQFAFQGAIVLVLPWAVAALGGGLSFSIFSLAGAAMQGVGLAVFCLLTRRVGKPEIGDGDLVFELLVGAWMRVLSGVSLAAALPSAVEAGLRDPGRQRGRWEFWRRWTEAFRSGTEADFTWPVDMPESGEAAGMLAGPLRTGAPCEQLLSDRIQQLDEERQFALEERLGALPARLSLVFCFFFTPALFLILMGALWPSMSVFLTM